MARRKHDPTKVRKTRYSVYVSETLDSQVDRKWDKIVGTYGSLNNWINTLIERGLREL